jgi:hypothetical protein
MGFWVWSRFSWAVLALLWLLAGPLAAEEAPVPWLLQPLDTPSAFRLSDSALELDYRQRDRPGWVKLNFRTRLSNSKPEAVSESLLFVTADPDATVTYRGKELKQERLVMPLPNSQGEKSYVSGRVSVVRVIMLAGEQGELEYRGRHRLTFVSPNRHQLTCFLPLRRAWQRVDAVRVTVHLAPELRLLAPQFVKENQVWVLESGKQRGGSLEIQAEARWLTAPAWGGAVAAVPPLRRSWLAGLVAVLLAVSVVVWRPGWWWLSAPLAMLLHGLWIHRDPTSVQWTYYQGARLYEQGLQAFRWYAVPGMALLATLFVILCRQPARGLAEATQQAKMAREDR